MCLIKGAFVGEKNLNVIKMHGTTIKIKTHNLCPIAFFRKLCPLGDKVKNIIRSDRPQIALR
jgi:hypothetical protein